MESDCCLTLGRVAVKISAELVEPFKAYGLKTNLGY
jgi:hypothetical protein